MAEPLLTDTTMIYGFALFFIFFVLIVLIIRYSNKELVKKFSNIYDKLKNAEKDIRHLAETEMASKKELKHEIAELRKEIDELNGSRGSAQKEKAIAKATA